MAIINDVARNILFVHGYAFSFSSLRDSGGLRDMLLKTTNREEVVEVMHLWAAENNCVSVEQGDTFSIFRRSETGTIFTIRRPAH